MTRRAEKITDTVLLILSFLLGIAVVWLGFVRCWRSVDSALLIVLLFLCGAFSSIVCSAFHELGHLIFGALCGFRFISVHIGPLKIYRKGNKISCAFYKMSSDVAGVAEMVPERTDGLRRKTALFICGGLLFSLLFFAGTAVALGLFRSIPVWVYLLVCTSLPYAFYLFFRNLIPFEGTDGAFLFGLLKREDSSAVALDLLAIESFLYRGYTPSEIPAEYFFSLPQLPEDDLNFILLTVYRLAYYQDGGDVQGMIAACNRLRDLLDYVPDCYFPQVASEVLFTECLIAGGEIVAKEMFPSLNKLLKREKLPHSHRILSAYELYINEDAVSALSELEAAEEEAEECPLSGMKKYEKKLLAHIRADMA